MKKIKILTPISVEERQISIKQRSSLSLKAKLGIMLLNLGLCLTTTAAVGAEKIFLDYGPLQFSLSVEALEIYAREGKIEPEFDTYAKFLNEEQLEQLQTLLVTKADLTPVAVSQFLYSPQGEAILQQLSQVIQTQAGQPGFYGIRAALILAAADEEGLTPLNVLKKFPTFGIKIASERGFEILDQLGKMIEETEKAIAAVEKQAIIEASESKLPSYTLLSDLREDGTFTVTKQTLTLEDKSRDRTIPTDLYLPQQQSSNLLPLVVISHGLGSERTTFEYLARHLASHGFAVAALEHPGSNAQQIQALINGLADEVTPPYELIDRPLDVKFLLDELQSSFGQQLNVQQVGVIGQSFGGYTILALAGAQLNFEQLQQDCQPSNSDLNLSLLLQCSALELPETNYNLQDKRVTAAIAINPVTSSIFGEAKLSQIKTPVMLVASSNDAVTPALSEQIIPFTWLPSPEKYLVLMKSATHFSTLAESNR